VRRVARHAPARPRAAGHDARGRGLRRPHRPRARAAARVPFRVLLD
jgi:hypothetical protein